jgi:formamidopyrimidine-DNA glycosylase
LSQKYKNWYISTLLDQNTIAGIGNIYVDENLFQVRIHPELSINDISDDQVKELYGKDEAGVGNCHNGMPSLPLPATLPQGGR